MNSGQREAVRMCLARSDIAIIHGPPGTGKTTTIGEASRGRRWVPRHIGEASRGRWWVPRHIGEAQTTQNQLDPLQSDVTPLTLCFSVEVVRQLVHRNEKVLVCAPSNIAVDNLLLKLSSSCNVVRVGHPARVNVQLHQYSLGNYTVTL